MAAATRVDATTSIGEQPGSFERPDDLLFDVIERLPFNQRAAVVMRFYERITETEIAAALDCKPGSVGPWIHRALTAMRKELS